MIRKIWASRRRYVAEVSGIVYLASIRFVSRKIHYLELAQDPCQGTKNRIQSVGCLCLKVVTDECQCATGNHKVA